MTTRHIRSAAGRMHYTDLFVLPLPSPNDEDVGCLTADRDVIVFNTAHHHHSFPPCGLSKSTIYRVLYQNHPRPSPVGRRPVQDPFAGRREPAFIEVDGCNGHSGQTLPPGSGYALAMELERKVVNWDSLIKVIEVAMQLISVHCV